MKDGNVYRQLDDLGEVPAGLWVVVEIGRMIRLSRLGEDEDGNLCTTHRKVKVTRDEMEHFVWMELRITKPLTYIAARAIVYTESYSHFAVDRLVYRQFRLWWYCHSLP